MRGSYTTTLAVDFSDDGGVLFATMQNILSNFKIKTEVVTFTSSLLTIKCTLDTSETPGFYNDAFASMDELISFLESIVDAFVDGSLNGNGNGSAPSTADERYSFDSGIDRITLAGNTRTVLFYGANTNSNGLINSVTTTIESEDSQVAIMRIYAGKLLEEKTGLGAPIVSPNPALLNQIGSFDIGIVSTGVGLTSLGLNHQMYRSPSQYLEPIYCQYIDKKLVVTLARTIPFLLPLNATIAVEIETLNSSTLDFRFGISYGFKTI
jgi:hypothetical protein